MNHRNLHFKRLQHPATSRGHSSTLPNAEAMLNTIQNSSRPLSRPFPNHAKRGGRTASGRRWHPSASLPKRAIYYDLAESLMDHSTNPLSSDLYKVHFKHSTKQWPDGRFRKYKEKLELADDRLVDIICLRVIPTVPKRRKILETSQDEPSSIDVVPSSGPVDPILQEQKKKLASQQTNIYASFYGSARAPQVIALPAASQLTKQKCVAPSTTPSTSAAIVDQNQEA